MYVRIVPARHRGQRVGAARVGLKQHVAVESRAHDGFAVKVVQSPEGIAVLVDDNNRVTFFG